MATNAALAPVSEKMEEVTEDEKTAPKSKTFLANSCPVHMADLGKYSR